MISESIQNRAESANAAGIVSAVDSFGERIRGLFAAFVRERKIEYELRQAIAHLHSLSDAQLRDIGIARADIERAVRYGKEQL